MKPETWIELAEANGWSVMFDDIDVDGCASAQAVAFSCHVDHDGSVWSFLIAIGRSADSGRWVLLEDDDTGHRLKGVLFRADGTEHLRHWDSSPKATLKEWLADRDGWCELVRNEPWFRATPAEKIAAAFRGIL